MRAIFGASRLFGRAFFGERLAALLLLGLDLRPDLVEFLSDEPLGHLELIAGGERVEQPALDLLARDAGVFGLDALAQRLAQRFQRFDAEALGEFVVDRQRLGLGDRLDGHVEFAGLAGEPVDRIILREGRLDDPLLARLDADQRVLEAGNEGVGAEDRPRCPCPSPPSNAIAVDRADEIDGDAVAGLGAPRPPGGR